MEWTLNVCGDLGVSVAPGGAATVGPLRVILEERGSDHHLMVSDDGPGFEGSATASSLGIRLMKRLAGQLNGNLAIASSAGTSVKLKWPVSSPAKLRSLERQIEE